VFASFDVDAVKQLRALGHAARLVGEPPEGNRHTADLPKFGAGKSGGWG
jgi:hypothetical protein